ncbi:MAG: TIGR03560 family F420-dependent LLM class oxidoreductase [Candidatus Limnocylindrales bacterium]
MKAGLLIPQGWKYEYNGWDPAAAWSRTLDLARHAEDLGFESEWVFDHFHTVPDPTDEITFESFTTLTAIAGVTSRVRLGHMVICTGFRNPALVAKLAATLDVASGGRFELGIGGGWKEEEWLAYGYGFPPIGDRLGALRDGLEIITRMLAPGRATYEGKYASVKGAINVPKGIQKPRPPIIVGGNGREVTLRLAARFADELNLVYIGTDEASELMALARERCEEIGRDPATLRISLYCADRDSKTPGQRRVDFIGRCAQIGLDRLIAFPTSETPTRESQARYAGDCRAAGVELASPQV